MALFISHREYGFVGAVGVGMVGWFSLRTRWHVLGLTERMVDRVHSTGIAANTRSDCVLIGVPHLVYLHALFRGVQDGWHVPIRGHVSGCVSLPTVTNHFKSLFFVFLVGVINIDLA